jgi:uncharacterized protein YcbK (DUF882 family)
VAFLKVRRQKRRWWALVSGRRPVYGSDRMRAASSVLGTSVLLSVIALGTFCAPPAYADVTHVVLRGHTLEAIAHRYHVTVEAIVEANHLKEGQHLKPGEELVIPGVDGPHPGHSLSHASASYEKPLEPRGHHAGIIHAIRAGEEFHIRVMDSRGHIAEAALKEFARMSRQGNSTHPPDPRLVALVGIVSDHFGGRTLEIVSGYRAYTPTQYTPHSNHNYGKALDFRIQGVPNEALRDFCRTLRNTGCGYYPNSTFVHLDARDSKAFWVDWSHPGEAPQYEKPGVLADEGASDVPDENAPASSPPHTVPPGSSSASPRGSGPPGDTPPTMPSNDSVQSL